MYSKSSDVAAVPGDVIETVGLCSKSNRAEDLVAVSYRQRSISLSDHCPIMLSQGSETVFRRRLCRSMSLSYGFNHLCHGRGRGFESRLSRSRH